MTQGLQSSNGTITIAYRAHYAKCYYAECRGAILNILIHDWYGSFPSLQLHRW